MPQTSSTATAAFILAALSPVLICLCYSSIPASIAAIVLGHLSLNKIAKAGSPMGGRGWSITALALAYPVLVISVVLAGFSLNMVYQRAASDSANTSKSTLTDRTGDSMNSDADAQARFQEAERQILALQGESPGRGNSPAAIRVAELFAEKMLDVRNLAFTKGKKPLFQLSRGQFITYVELHKDRALFLVHVPDYRKFSKEAKEQMAQLAWMVAQLTLQDELPEDARLAIALKGTLLYGDILTGYFSKQELLQDNFLPGKKADLLSFFPSPATVLEPPVTTAQPMRDAASNAASNAASDVASTDPSANNAAPLSATPRVPATPVQPQSGTLSADPMPGAHAGDLASNTNAPIPTPALTPERIPKSRPAKSSPPRSPAERFESFEPKLTLTPALKIPKKSWAYLSMTWSPDSKWLAAGKIDDTLTLFDASNGEVLSEVKKLDDLQYFSALAFSFDGRFLTAATNSGQTALLQVDPRGRLQHVMAMYRHAKGCQVVASSPRFPFVASGGKDGTIAWQTMAVPSQTKLLQHFKREPLAIWLPSEGTNALALSGETMLQFSLRDASIVSEKPIGLRNARSACFSPNGSQCVVVDYHDIYWKNCSDHKPAVKIYNAKKDNLSTVVFHPNDRWLAVCGYGNVLILDIVAREPLARITFDSMATVKCLQFSPDGKRLAVSFQSSDADIHFFDIQPEDNSASGR